MLGDLRGLFCDPTEQGEGRGGALLRWCSEATGPERQTGLGLWDHLPSLHLCLLTDNSSREAWSRGL